MSLIEVVALTLLLMGSLLALRVVVASDTGDESEGRSEEGSPQGQPARSDLRRAA